MEITTEVLDQIMEHYNQFYRNAVNSVFEIPFEENPEAFLLYDLKKVDSFLLKTSTDYIVGGKYHLLLFQGNGTKKVYELNLDDYKNLYKYNTDDDKFMRDFVIDKFKATNFITTTLTSQIDILEVSYQNVNEWLIQNTNIFQIWAMTAAKSHAKQFSEHINQPAYLYADRAYKYTYSDLDFTDVIVVVNDKDFEYALNESLAAYEHNLYLAATSTAGTALENLIITILEKESIEFDYNQGTELGRLTNLLLKEGIINKKMKQRIMNSASLRNLASHANKGRTIREDAKSIYQIIYTLSSEVYLSQV